MCTKLVNIEKTIEENEESEGEKIPVDTFHGKIAPCAVH